MTDEEKAIELQRQDVCVIWNDGCPNVREAALKMAKWKEEQILEKAVDRGYLTDWYQSSVDETQEPIWTDKHLDELYGDFYLIPKQIMEE